MSLESELIDILSSTEAPPKKQLALAELAKQHGPIMRLEDARLVGSDLSHLSLRSVRLSRSQLIDIKCEGTQFATLESCDVIQAVGAGASFLRAYGCTFEGCDLPRSAFGPIMDSCRFQESDLSNSRWAHRHSSDVKACRFVDVSMRGFDAAGCDLTCYVISRCDLTDARMSRAVTDNLMISQSTLDGVNLVLTELRPEQLVDSTLSRVLVTGSEIARRFDASKQEIIVVPIPARRCERVGLVAESAPRYRAKWVFSRGMAIDRVIMFRDSEGGSHNVATVGSAIGVDWESYRDYTKCGLTMALVGLVGDYMRWNCGQIRIDEVEGVVAERLRVCLERLFSDVRR